MGAIKKTKKLPLETQDAPISFPMGAGNKRLQAPPLGPLAGEAQDWSSPLSLTSHSPSMILVLEWKLIFI